MTIQARFSLYGRYVLLPALLIVLWHLAARFGLTNRALLPPPEFVLVTAYQSVVSGELVRHVADSLIRIAWANAIAIGLGVPIGILMGLYRPFEEIVDGVLSLLRPIPPIAWIPLAILWFGIGQKTVIFITLLAAFFTIVLNTLEGVRGVDRSLVRAALSLGATRWVLISRVTLPAALPSIFVGIRIAVGVSWMSIVAGELIAATSGLGFMISFYRELLRTDLILVGMAAIGIIGFLMDQGLRRIERRLLPWRAGLRHP